MTIRGEAMLITAPKCGQTETVRYRGDAGNAFPLGLNVCDKQCRLRETIVQKREADTKCSDYTDCRGESKIDELGRGRCFRGKLTANRDSGVGAQAQRTIRSGQCSSPFRMDRGIHKWLPHLTIRCMAVVQQKYDGLVFLRSLPEFDGRRPASRRRNVIDPPQRTENVVEGILA